MYVGMMPENDFLLLLRIQYFIFAWIKVLVKNAGGRDKAEQILTFIFKMKIRISAADPESNLPFIRNLIRVPDPVKLQVASNTEK